jgi:2-hydroxy-3-oxopropionate reductase
MANVGFIGLGIMGRPMAGHLIDAGHTVHLHSRSGAPQALVDKGGVRCESPQQVAQRADVIVTMLPDTPDVERVLFGDNGWRRGLRAGRSSST